MEGTNNEIENVMFLYFCNLCEKIRTQKFVRKKEEILKNFFAKYRNNSSDYFPVLRLLLPHLDRTRGPYGMKVHNLTRIYKRILCIPDGSVEAQKLTNVRSDEDFSERIFWVLRNRCGPGNEMTLKEINSCLDMIAEKHSCSDPRGVDDVFGQMVQKMSNEEQKWIIKIIMKSLNLGIWPKRIMNIYHPDSSEVHDVTNNLHDVCRRLSNPNIRLNELAITLFQSFKPMLCARCDVRNIVLNGPNCVETKLDGERFQIHYQNGKFKYFSRNGYEYSNNYGGDPESGHFTYVIAKQISPEVESFIFDGEMMGWNRERKRLVQKGANLDVKSLRLGNVIQPCFYVFDIVFHNGIVITNKPLKERIEIAEKVFVPLEGVLMHVPRVGISSTEEAIDALNKAIDNYDEGVVIKTMNSIYKPNSRKNDWLKVKPEYSEGTVDLDLLVIGGFYGEGKFKGQIRRFMLGVYSGTIGGIPDTFQSLCTVSSGINEQEYQEINSKLATYWKRLKGAPPPFLLLKKEKPDVWIDPKNSLVLQVKSPEVVRSDQYYTGYTLRFARVERTRYDKQWSDCLRAEEFQALRTASSGKLTAGHVPEAKRRKISTKKQETIKATTYNLKKVSNIFIDKEICIISGDSEYSKSVLEANVLTNGGKIVEQPDSSTFCVLYGDENIRVRNIIQAKKHNVAKYSWLLECIAENRIIPWNKFNITSPNTTALNIIAQSYDDYGDSFFEPTSMDTLEKIIKTMAGDSFITEEEILEMDEYLFFGVSPFSVFRSCSIYFDKLEEVEGSAIHKKECLKKVELLFKFLSGLVCRAVNPSVSYIIVHENHLDNLPELVRICKKEDICCQILNHRWILDCWNSKKMVDTDPFVVCSMREHFYNKSVV